MTAVRNQTVEPNDKIKPSAVPAGSLVLACVVYRGNESRSPRADSSSGGCQSADTEKHTRKRRYALSQEKSGGERSN